MAGVTAMSEAEDRNQRVIEEFRANGGRVGGPFEGRTLLLLHHRGARSGRERVNPVVYQRVGDALAVFASHGGAPTHPDWYHNLLAHPEVTVEVGTETRSVVARVPAGEERERIWETQKATYPIFAEYERRAAGRRQIPVVVLEKR
jgi:deazaflavin-dependent oxidoreductase (nitroreductase family)